ncbi:MAG TPA: hypothetical protein DDW36_03575 [Candidatus Magasanikbacteria bacterium]|nr:hypothetical protein [Candidatus Magasanikbacteria bacterium]
MQLPKELPEQTEKTLLFVTDTTRAKWYLIDGRAMSKAGSFLNPKPEYTGKERMPHEIIENQHQVFCKQAARHLEDALRTIGVHRIVIATPHNIKNQFEHVLSANVKQKIRTWHDTNLYRFSGMDIARRLLK